MDFENFSWDNIDDDFGREFLKFERPKDAGVQLLYNEKVEEMHIEPIWDSLEKYTNSWNKIRYRLKVKKINYQKVFKQNDEVLPEEYFLDCGARLLKELSKVKGSKYVHILKFGEKFQTRYVAQKYKLWIEGAIKPKKTPPKNGK